MMVGGGEQVEIVSAHALADVHRRIFARPRYLNDQLIAVEPEVWHQARGELRDLMERRGWPVLACDKTDRANFLLCGVAVVMTQ